MALNLVQKFKDKRKSTIKELQKLAGHLNFINRAVIPGRVFTRSMYAKFSGPNVQKLKPHHHIKLDKEFRWDCSMWENFLLNINAVVRPFIDLNSSITAETLNFYSDASANAQLGFGVIFGDEWTFGKWEENFVDECKPSIEFLELFTLCVGIYTWQNKITRTRVIVFCDNEAVVHMINNSSSSCEYCMKLLRLLTLNNLLWDRRVFTRHMRGKDNKLSDALSHMQFNRFFDLAPLSVKQYAEKLPVELWLLRKKIWEPEVVC